MVAMPEVDRAGRASRVTIALADGRRFGGWAENGMPQPGELEDKFRRPTVALSTRPVP